MPLICPGVEDAVNPSLEDSWRHPWRRDLLTGADEWHRQTALYRMANSVVTGK
ncbi:hypothetical protein [Halorhodospira halochloris]|uniref:hypothetical protein n=1 Tax=Halorhodospira halochloris TaxID=1052 RepID=UPI0013A569F2|nr:hypothetical protein [Halorhodospira halochloris]